MSYKDLLVGLDSDASARERIEIAAALAERFAAHLVGLYPLPMPEAPRHFGYYDPALLNPFFEELRPGRAMRPTRRVRCSSTSPAFTVCRPGGGKFPRGRMPIRRSTPATPFSQSSASSIPIAVNPI
jgi:hypothetical protein